MSYRILAIDGGGNHGLLTSVILQRLEREVPGFLDQIDLITGTSTGSIIACGLAAGFSPSQLVDFYKQSSNKIFYKKSLTTFGIPQNLFSPLYTGYELKSQLMKCFGLRKLEDLFKKVLVPTIELDNTHGKFDPSKIRTYRTAFFHNFNFVSLEVVDLLMRATAAPSIYPPYQGYADGALTAMDPSICGLVQALDPKTGKQKLEDIKLLSLGTGFTPDFIEGESPWWGLFQWKDHILDICINGQEGMADFECSKILRNNYFRLNPLLSREFNSFLYTDVDKLEGVATKVDLRETIAWLQTWAN